jgi:hypothetical protein
MRRYQMPAAVVMLAVSATTVLAVKLISVKDEIEIGRQAQQQVKADVPELREDSVRSYVAGIGRTLAARTCNVQQCNVQRSVRRPTFNVRRAVRRATCRATCDVRRAMCYVRVPRVRRRRHPRVARSTERCTLNSARGE